MEIKYEYTAKMVGEFHLVMYERTLIAHDGIVTFYKEPAAHVKEFLARKGFVRVGPEPEPTTPEPETPAPETPKDPEPEPATEPETPAPEPEPSSPVDLKGKASRGKGGKKSDQ